MTTITNAGRESEVTALLSALAANRKAFFDLVEIAEQQLGCDIDELVLQTEIDEHYSGRDKLTDDEARDLLMKVSRVRTVRDQPPAGGG